jgi:cob(I)alamin adenosyltransferase
MLHIYYGKGKGKTSSSLGLILRACSYNKRIILLQFLKPIKVFSGEQISLKKFKNVKHVRFNQKHPIFTKDPDIKKLKQNINKCIVELKKIIQKKDFDILVCDEILNIIHKGIIKEEDIIKIFNKIKDKKEIILTGRNKPNKLLSIADYATEFRLVKHPFQKGILARRAIEF